MADKRKPGYCTYCATRVWATRGNHLWTNWKCANCGSAMRYVGETAIRQAESLVRQAETEQAIRNNPEATLGGESVDMLPPRDPIFGSRRPRT